MLSKDEETKLDCFTEIIELSKENSKFPQLSAYDIEWLVIKLKEVNEIAKKQAQQLDRIKAYNELYSHKNEISDRFYPR